MKQYDIMSRRKCQNWQSSVGCTFKQYVTLTNRINEIGYYYSAVRTVFRKSVHPIYLMKRYTFPDVRRRVNFRLFTWAFGGTLQTSI